MASSDDFIVKFYDVGSGWLHTETEVKGVALADVLPTAIAQVKDDSGIDVSTYRTAVTYAANGHGVPNLDNVQSKAALQAQIAQLAEQLKRLPDDESPSSEVTAPPAFNSDTTPDPSLNPATSQVKPGLEINTPASGKPAMPAGR